MSPVEALTKDGNVRFPRVSGDEPQSFTTYQATTTFSPRERG